MWLTPPPKKEKTAHQKHTKWGGSQSKVPKGSFDPESSEVRCLISGLLLQLFQILLEWFYSEVTGGVLYPGLYPCQMVDLVTSTPTILYFTPHYSCQIFLCRVISY